MSAISNVLDVLGFPEDQRETKGNSDKILDVLKNRLIYVLPVRAELTEPSRIL